MLRKNEEKVPFFNVVIAWQTVVRALLDVMFVRIQKTAGFKSLRVSEPKKL